MKLSDLLDYIPHTEVIARDNLDAIEVRRVVELDDPTLDDDVLRWTAEPRPLLGINGVLITREARAVMPNAVIICDDPKASIIDAIKALYTPRQLAYGRVDAPVGMCYGPGTVIGEKGFGFHNGERFPHIGGVQLGEDVEIGSNTTIDRGAIGDTIIGARTKIDNLVHIAHNARIGTDCLIVAHATIGGSAILGNGVFVGMGAQIKNKVRIGDGATIGMGAVVTKNVPAGETWVGNPARKLEKVIG